MTQQPVSPPPSGGGPAPFESRHDRHMRRHERRAESSPWLLGAILIVVGGVLLLQSLHLTPGNFLTNWWALFILLPAFGSFARAASAYRAGDSPVAIIGPLIGGLVFLVVTVTFLLNLPWGLIGPVLLIAGGVAVLLGAMGGRPKE